LGSRGGRDSETAPRILSAPLVSKDRSLRNLWSTAPAGPRRRAEARARGPWARGVGQSGWVAAQPRRPRPGLEIGPGGAGAAAGAPPKRLVSHGVRARGGQGARGCAWGSWVDRGLPALRACGGIAGVGDVAAGAAAAPERGPRAAVAAAMPRGRRGGGALAGALGCWGGRRFGLRACCSERAAGEGGTGPHGCLKNRGTHTEGSKTVRATRGRAGAPARPGRSALRARRAAPAGARAARARRAAGRARAGWGRPAQYMISTSDPRPSAGCGTSTSSRPL
jgi:hypothetical protein